MNFGSARRMRRFRLLSILASLAIASAVLVAGDQQPAVAANPANFDAGYIVSDANFYDANAMTQAEIQAFLVAKGSGLAHLRFSATSRAKSVSDSTGNVRCEAYTGGTDLPASTIIFRTQQACGISAKAILVTLQKEQGLITKGAPSLGDLNFAMGYACPDSGSCTVAGFDNQVYLGAKQLKTYSASRFGYFQPGWRTVQWKPYSNCGTSDIYIQNNATAALYNYTPYRPNAAALAAYPGEGDGCSSYGNRNFWFLFSDWFGAPTEGPPVVQNPTPTGANPRGAYDQATLTSSKDGAFVRGWAFDSDTRNSILVDFYVNSTWNRTLTANQARPDVQDAYPAQSPNHGFSATFPLPPGTHSLCAYAINVGGGTLNTPLGCRSVTVPVAPPVDPPTDPVPPVDPPAPEVDTGAAPRGDVNEMRVSGTSVFLRGWTFDPDTTNPIRADVWANGRWRVTLEANQPRPDVKAAFPAQGANHGFSGTVALSPGTNQVCVYGINNGRGANPLLQCRTLTVAGATPPPTTPPPTTPPPAAPGGSNNPRGDMNDMVLTGSSLFMRGWTFDADTKDPILADIWVNGRWKSTMNANVARSDVQAAFPGQGPNHGFSSTITLSKGANQVCVYGINNNAGGANPLIQCRSFVVN